jgi:hypothetical protein
VTLSGLLLTLSLSALCRPAPPAPWAPGGASRPEDLVITVVTFGPGDDLPSWWGHTALVVDDTRLRQGRLYNYGMFGFSTGFLHKFVQGRLEFWVGEDSVVGTYAYYKQLDRDVRLQVLNLTPAQAQQVALALAENVTVEHCEYLYQHYDDNCSTRPRDIVDAALNGALTVQSFTPARMSLREQTRRYSQVFPPMSLVLDYLQNDILDRPITQREEAFLPDELERQLDALKIDGQSIVKQKLFVHKAKDRKPVPEVAPNWNVWLLIGSVLVGLGVTWLRRRQSRLARLALGLFLTLEGAVWGSLGVFLFIVSLWTNHEVAHRNENLFLIEPLTFLLLPFGLMFAFGSKRAEGLLRVTTLLISLIALVGLALKVLPSFDQQNWNLICLVLPLTLLTSRAFIMSNAKR